MQECKGPKCIGMTLNIQELHFSVNSAKTVLQRGVVHIQFVQSRVKSQESRVNGSGSADSDSDIITTYNSGRSSNDNDTNSVTFSTEVTEGSDI